MKKTTILLFVIVSSISFLQMDCKEAEPTKPCTDCPLPVKDTIMTIEKELADGQMPAVSPDGKKIAYTYKGDIWVCDTAGLQIVTRIDSSQYPWIFYKDTIGSRATQLTFGSEVEVMPRWNPNGQTVGFIRTNQGEYNKGLLFTVPATGGGATQLVVNQFVADSLIQQSRSLSGGSIGIPIWEWSPDGKYVAYFSVEGFKTFLNAQSLFDGNIKLYRETYDFNNSSGGRSFTWSFKPDEIVFISGDKIRYGAVHKFNLIAKTEIIDSTLEFPNSLSRSLNSNKFIYVGLNKNSDVVIVETDLSKVYNEYMTMGNRSLRWSPDEKYILYELPGMVGGPLGYSYSRLFIFDIERKKDYMLTDNGDNNLHNYFFEWGKSSNIVLFERFGKIVKSTFKLP